MEVIRAFCGEAGPLTPEPAEEVAGDQGRESLENVRYSTESYNADVGQPSFVNIALVDVPLLNRHGQLMNGHDFLQTCFVRAMNLPHGMPDMRSFFLAQVGDPEFRLILKEVLNLAFLVLSAAWTERPPPLYVSLFVSPGSVM